jgi:porin
VNSDVGNGVFQGLSGPSKESGVTFGGLVVSDGNILMAGGAQPGALSWNNFLIVSMTLDGEKLLGWKGADFGVQFLQFNGGNSNGEAGSVQGYNGLPGAPPWNRSELYQAWYRQKFFDDKLIIRIGRTAPSYDFNNVCRPVVTQDASLEIPSVSGLIYAPIFVNPTMLGALPGYYNSADGVTVTVAPTQSSYINFGCYNGNQANGVQTGMVGTQLNGYYFNILETGADWIIAKKYPGQFGIGTWYQTGILTAPGNITQNGTGGIYFFGGQRIWGRSSQPALAPLPYGEGKPPADLSSILKKQNSSISLFYQFGVNNSETLPVNKYVGAGITGLGLIPKRPADSMGFGTAWSWLNPHLFNRSSELMFQTYYQAHLYGGVFLQPVLSYIPTPGASASLPSAWAFTLRVTMLF